MKTMNRRQAKKAYKKKVCEKLPKALDKMTGKIREAAGQIDAGRIETYLSQTQERQDAALEAIKEARKSE